MLDKTSSTISVGLVLVKLFGFYIALALVVHLQGSTVFLYIGNHTGNRFLVYLKLRLLHPQNLAGFVQPVGPQAEHQAGCLAIAVALKPNAPVNVKQQTVPKMGFQFFFVPASAKGARKVNGVCSHGNSPPDICLIE